MSGYDKIRGDEFEKAIRRMIDNLLELHSLPRKRWKKVDLCGFKAIGRKIGVVLNDCKMGGNHLPLNKGLVPQDGDETEEES